VQYKLVIFDFDGTLADTFPWFVQHVHQASARFNFRRVEDVEIPHLRKRSAREVIDHLGIPLWKIPLIARHMQAAMALDAANMQLFDGVGPVLRELRESGVTLAVVSSNVERNVRAILGAELGALVSVYDCGASLFRKAAKFQRVLKRTGFSRGDTICIGDEIRDHEAAQSAGIHFGAVAWGYTDFEALRERQPEMIFERVEELAGAIAINVSCPT
jgi:phosphoglycolate phosphatase